MSSNPQYDVSLGKTLLGNWVEERQVAHIDCKKKSIKDLHVGGHFGVLTQAGDKLNDISTNIDVYKTPDRMVVQKVGKKKQLYEKELYEKISAEIQERNSCPPPPIDYTSTTKKDFHKGNQPTVFSRLISYLGINFQPIERQFTVKHDVNKDTGMTFWNQNIQAIDGVTQIATQQIPFRKNASFSTPIHEYKGSVKPGEAWEF